MAFIRLLYTAVFSLTISVVFAQTQPGISTENFFNDRELIQKAGISKEFIYVYLVKKEKLKDSAIAAMIFYDANGNITKYERFDEPIVGQTRYDYQYNERGLATKVLITRAKNPNWTIDLMYDSAGNEIIKSTGNKLSSHIEWKEYDEKGRLVKQYDKINGGKRYLAFTNTWAHNNLLISKQSYDDLAKPTYSETYKYSPDSLRVQKYFTNKYITKLESETFYNSAFQKTMTILYQDDLQNHTDYSYMYNSDGTIKEWSASYENKLVYVKRHFYYFFD